MSWSEGYRRQVTSAEEAVKVVRSGDHVWLHAGCNNPEELLKAMVGRAGELRDVEVTHLAHFGAADRVDPRYSGSFRHHRRRSGATNPSPSVTPIRSWARLTSIVEIPGWPCWLWPGLAAIKRLWKRAWAR